MTASLQAELCFFPCFGTLARPIRIEARAFHSRTGRVGQDTAPVTSRQLGRSSYQWVLYEDFVGSSPPEGGGKTSPPSGPTTLDIPSGDLIKRLVVADTDGLLLAIIVHAADIQDADSLDDLLRRVKPLYAWFRVVFAGSIYNQLVASLACFLAGLVMIILAAQPAPPGPSCSRAVG